MAKLPEKCDKVKNISASQIMNYLQTNRITNEIFVEILSDLNKKQGFKNLRKMVEDLIHTHEGPLYSPNTEPSCRATIINELCTVAFTIDTVFPNVLRMKFQNEFPNLINDILEELKTENKIDSYVPFVPSASASKETLPKTVPVSTTANGQRPAKSTSPVQSTSKELPPPDNNVSTESAVKEKDVHHGRPQTKKNLNASTEQQVVRNDIKSDAVESEIFNDDLSVTSVSSVHTSELSSFDDAISVSSEDGTNGRKKKRVSIVDIQQACKSERISSWCAENFNGIKLEAKDIKEDAKSSKNPDKHSKANSATKDSGNKARNLKESITEAMENDKSHTESKVSSDESSPPSPSNKELSSTAKVLPQRIRKPNSKYTSDSIICPMASKQQKRMKENQSVSTDRVEPHSPQRKKTKHVDSEDDSDDDRLEIVSESPKSNQQASLGNKENSEKKKSPMHSTADVFKPFTSVRPLTSRRTGPMTLFSTQSLKK